MPVRYYTLGGNTLSVRQGASVSWLYGDHLGSTSASSGAASTSERYYAYGYSVDVMLFGPGGR